MIPTLEQLGIDQLTADQRIVLAHEILDSVIAEREFPPLTEAQQAEIRRRIAHLEANPDDVVPWAEVEAKALARFKS